MIIALEEHYFDRDWNNAMDPAHLRERPSNPFFQKMEDLGAQRIKEMDEARIDPSDNFARSARLARTTQRSRGDVD